MKSLVRMSSLKVLLGKPVAEKNYSLLKDRIIKLKNEGIVPKLVVILVGDNAASKIYVNSKAKIFKQLNCYSEIIKLKENVSKNLLFKLINKLNKDNSIHGILLQLPLPKHLDSNNFLSKINPLKDVDGFHPENLGLLLQGDPRFIPCTPLGCIKILDYYKIDVKSKHVVIIGRSNIVGKPMMSLLSQSFEIGNATVTICHSYTKDLSEYTKSADIIICAVGRPNLINKTMIKEGCVIVDVGINRINDSTEKGYHIVGDVDYNSVSNIVGSITPVPGGVGPMTISMLVNNTILAAELSIR